MRIMEFFSMHGHDQLCTGMRNSLCRNQKCTYKITSAALAWNCDQHKAIKIQIMSGAWHR